MAVLGTFYDLSQPALSATILTADYGPAFSAAFEAGLANNVSTAVPGPVSLVSLSLAAISLMLRRRPADA